MSVRIRMTTPIQSLALVSIISLVSCSPTYTPVFEEDHACYGVYERPEDNNECSEHSHCEQLCHDACMSGRGQPTCGYFPPEWLEECPTEILDEYSCKCIDSKCKWGIEEE